jgi:hypothetical protein
LVAVAVVVEVLVNMVELVAVLVGSNHLEQT